MYERNTVFGVFILISLWSNATFASAATASAAPEHPAEQTGASDSAPQPNSDNASDKATPNFSGNISWYGIPFHGKRTASGEIFDMYKFSAAHLHLPFGTKVLVEDPRTGNTVLVKVNDRGPFVKTRVMDVSKGAATKLGTIGRGVSFVDCLVISKAGSGT
jgi:rare lipoprotein A